MMIDLTHLVEHRRQDLLSQADRARLAAQLPASHSVTRRQLAVACYRLANWLDNPDRAQYLRLSQSGAVDWARLR
jgi:hypothetical protein